MDPRELLERDLPDLAVDSVVPLGEGWDHAAFLVNQTYVFRLPWHLIEDEPRPDDVPIASVEVGLLRALAGKLPVQVPDPVFIPKHGDYFGYRYLAGSSIEQLLDSGRWASGSVMSLVDSVVDVVVAIEQAVSQPEVTDLRLRVASLQSYPDEEETALGSERVTGEIGDQFLRVRAELPAMWGAAMERPVTTLHADLGLDHWLVDDGGNPYALIDWSDSCTGPPELQISTLMWHVPELTVAVAHGYARRTGRVLDGSLIHALGYANAVSDLGALLREDDEIDEDGIASCLQFLDHWSQASAAATLRAVTFQP